MWVRLLTASAEKKKKELQKNPNFARRETARKLLTMTHLSVCFSTTPTALTHVKEQINKQQRTRPTNWCPCRCSGGRRTRASERAAEEEGKSTPPSASPQISRAQRAIGGSLQFITSNSSSVGETHHYEESTATERLERRRGQIRGNQTNWSSLTI